MRDANFKGLNETNERSLKNEGVEYIHGRACFIGMNESLIKVDDGTEIKV